MGRAPCCEKVGLKRGRWTAEEDEILIKYIEANGEGSWRTLPKNAGLLRCGKSCRLRWINYLRSDLKRGNISAEEEELIIKLHASLGNRWSLIAGHLPGRTDNEIKNYWNSHLSRKLQSFQTFSDQSQSSGTLPSSSVVVAAEDLAKPGHKRPRTTRSKPRQPKPKKKKPSSTIHPPPQILSSPEQSNVTTTVPVPPGTPRLEKESLSTSIATMRCCQMDDKDQEDTLENIISSLGSLAKEGSTTNVPCTSEFTSYVDLLWVPEEESAAANVLCKSRSTNPHPPGIMIQEEGITSSEDLLAISDGFLDYVNKEHESATGSTSSSSSSSNNDNSEGVKAKEMEVSNNYEKLEGGEGIGSWVDNWIWDDDDGDDRVVLHKLTAVFGEKADMLSWLWDVDDDGPGPGDGGNFEDGNNDNISAAHGVNGVQMDDEKHNAMVAWLLS